MFYFDPMYFVFALPALLLALIAQWRVRAAINKYSKVYTGRGYTGARVDSRMSPSPAPAASLAITTTQ